MNHDVRLEDEVDAGIVRAVSKDARATLAERHARAARPAQLRPREREVVGIHRRLPARDERGEERAGEATSDGDRAKRHTALDDDSRDHTTTQMREARNPLRVPNQKKTATPGGAAVF